MEIQGEGLLGILEVGFRRDVELVLQAGCQEVALLAGLRELLGDPVGPVES